MILQSLFHRWCVIWSSRQLYSVVLTLLLIIDWKLFKRPSPLLKSVLFILVLLCTLKFTIEVGGQRMHVVVSNCRASLLICCAKACVACSASIFLSSRICGGLFYAYPVYKYSYMLLIRRSMFYFRVICWRGALRKCSTPYLKKECRWGSAVASNSI